MQKKICKNSLKFYITLIFCMSLMFVILGHTNVQAATRGEQIMVPEAGWKRIDDADSNFQYGGTWSPATNVPEYYNSSWHEARENAYVKFKVSSSKKLRVLGTKYGITSTASNQVQVFVNGQYNSEFSTRWDSGCSARIILAEINLPSTQVNEIKIVNNTNGFFMFDAVDIDDTGKILPYDSTTLTAAADNKKQNITLNWDKVLGQTTYDIKRSTTQGKGYELIASNIKETTYVDENVQAGKTYYYIVTPITNSVEGISTNEVSATLEKSTEPSKPDTKPDTKCDAVLTITMTNGNIKSYNVTMEKVNDFIKWYEGRANGSNGYPFYKFDKTDKNQDFKSKTEYIVFDKISSFEVDER